MLTDDLKKLIKGDVSVDETELQKYGHDYSIFSIKPQAVVEPKSADDVEALVKWAASTNKKGAHVSLTARAAGTDMSGGPLNDGVIVSFTKYLNKIKEIKSPLSGTKREDKKHSNILQNVRMFDSGLADGYAVVEPGVYFRDLEKELDKRGLMFPPYPASKDICAVGGMISNNSGGEKSLVYGKAEDYVESLKVVLADGNEYEIKALSAAGLKKKMRAKNFEGGIYKKLYELIEKNYDEIKKAKPDVSKNSTGYALWNVWNKKTFDLTRLFVGAQGTLGLITEAKLRLVKKKKYSGLVVVFAKTLEPVPELVEAILPFRPESIESYDDKTLEIVMRSLPAVFKLMGGSVFTLAWKFLPEFIMILKGGLPKMILLVEIASDDEKELAEKIGAVRRAALKFPVRVRAIKDKKEEEKYWTIRRRSFALLHDFAPGMRAEPFVDDIIVKPEFMAEFLPRVNAILDEYKKKFVYTIAGHPGNGNFHIIPLVNLKDPGTRKAIIEATDRIYELVLRYHGSLTAEHGDGLIRGPYLEEMYGKKIYGLFEEVKKIFDPLGIFNPRKKVGVKKDYMISVMKK